MVNFSSMIGIKEKIINKINNIKDPEMLEKLMQAIDVEYEIDQMLELSDKEISAIDEGINDADTGHLHSNTESSRLVKEWLKK